MVCNRFSSEPCSFFYEPLPYVSFPSSFPYWEEFAGGEARFYPKIPITIMGPGLAKAEVLALVDSGAEHNVFELDLAEELNVQLNLAQPVTVVGVGEQHIDGFKSVADYKLGRNHWWAPTIFSAAGNNHAILGHAGFFAYFNVSFRYEKRELEVRWQGDPPDVRNQK